MHRNDVFLNQVVIGVWKPLRKHPVQSMANRMTAAINREGINTGVKSIQERVPEVFIPVFIEIKFIFEIEFRLVENSDSSHDTRSRISFLAAS